jgi:hypothetical protein
MFRRSALTLAFLLGAFALLGRSVPADDGTEASAGPTRIGRITIVHEDIFDEINFTPVQPIFDLAEHLHIRTREGFIRSELLFREGDLFDSDRIAETERNLRRYRFVGRVKIERKQRPDGDVDLVVRLQDQWSATPSVYFKGGGGRSTAAVGFHESNFLGSGKEFDFSAGRGYRLNYFKARFTDPQLFGRRYRLDLRTTKLPSGSDVSADFQLPFYSTRSPLAYGVSLRRYRLYWPPPHLESYSYGYRHRLNVARYFVGVARRHGESRSHLTLIHEYQQNKFSPVEGRDYPGGLPGEDIILSLVSLRLGQNHYRWARERYFNKLGRVEDILLGLHYTLQLGRSLRALGAYRDETHMSFNYRAGTSLPGSSYLLLNGVAVSRYRRGGLEQSIWTNSLNFYSKVLPHQVLAVRLYNRVGNNLDPWSKFYLGGTDGLRGFSAWEFRGKKMAFLMNLENRLFVGREFLTLSPGLVVFFDCGTVWDTGEIIRSRDLHSDYGIGLRLGLNKMPGSMVLRLDYAIPLDSDRKGFFSFGTEQAF